MNLVAEEIFKIINTKRLIPLIEAALLFKDVHLLHEDLFSQLYFSSLQNTLLTNLPIYAI